MNVSAMLRTLIWILGFVNCFSSDLSAATTLLSFTGNSSPSAQGWSATANSNVTASTMVDEGRSVLKLVDPGLPSGNNYLNYTKTVTNDQIDSMMALGWEASMVLKIPTLDGENNTGWGRDQNLFMTLVFDNRNLTNRSAYGILFWRNANGEAMVGANGDSTSQFLVGNGYHEYSMRYNSSTAEVALYVDNQYLGLVPRSTLNNAGSNYFGWGDNSNQTGERLPRYALFQSVTLSQVPEPRILSFLAIALLFLLGIRVR